MSHEFDSLFRHHNCACPDAGALIMAELNGEPRPLCPMHDAPAIKARKIDADRTRAEADLARAYAIHEDVNARQAANRDERLRAEHDAAEEEALAQLDPLVADLHRLTGAPALQIVPPDTSIGDDDAFAAGLARLCGGTFNPSDPDFPTAA